MLDPHEYELLSRNYSNILNDIASHWKMGSQLSAHRMDDQEYRSAHTQGIDEPELYEDFS